jgi:hypothetical protein
MNRKPDGRPRWSTSSFGSPAHTSPMDLATLGEHLNRCTVQHGLLPALRRAGDALNEFAAPRVITTLTLFALLAVIGSLLT